MTCGTFGLIGELQQELQRRRFVLKQEIFGGKSIKGQTAFGGNVQGIVRVVLEAKDIQNVKEGEVLVSHMTTPNFLPAMQKSVAFVTDEGGITSHAAIIAREIRKPCVIGTKVATRALNTGDLVEVDADEGVINILERRQ